MRIKGADELGLSLSREQNEQFFIYSKQLIEWNNTANLTSITSEDEISTKHFLDSLSIVKVADLTEIRSVIDIGAGAGFPGIPLKIAYPHLSVCLVDSVRKKVAFMEHITKVLGLADTKAVFSRSEDLPPDMRESFDMAVSRAVAELSVLSEYCMPYVRVNGRFIAYKGGNIDEEINASLNAIKILGGRIEKKIEFELPGTDIKRSLVVIRKTERTPAAFPRRAGMAKKKPLS